MRCKTSSWLPSFFYAEPKINEELKKSIKPKFQETFYGAQIVSPDSPYIAAAGRCFLYFIDERLDIKQASFMKKQIEMSIPIEPKAYYYFDDQKLTVEMRDSQNKTLFAFSPAYSRVWHAEQFNEYRPELQLPIHPHRGNWLVHYDIPETLTEENKASESLIRSYSVDLGSEETGCMAIDTPRYEGESDAEYYKRMDDLHWRRSD